MKRKPRILHFFALALLLYTSFAAVAVSPHSVRTSRNGRVVGKLKDLLEEKGVRAADVPKAIAIHEW